MHALLVTGELVGLDPVRLHVLCIGMAVCAGGRNVRRMHLRARVGRRTQVVYAMAVGADGNVAVSLGPLHAVNARLVLLKLIDTKARIVFLHALGIRVTGSTKLGYLAARNFAFKPRRSAHRFIWVVTAGVPSMARNAAEPLARVDILRVGFRINSQRFRQTGMAIKASVFRLG